MERRVYHYACGQESLQVQLDCGGIDDLPKQSCDLNRPRNDVERVSVKKDAAQGVEKVPLTQSWW